MNRSPLCIHSRNRPAETAQIPDIDRSPLMWILQWLLAAMFLMAGVMKLMQPKEKLAERMGWANDFSSNTVKWIGVAEVLAAIGLVVSPLTDIAPISSPLAATGLVALMLGAAGVHRRRGETQMLAMTSMLAIVAARPWTRSVATARASSGRQISAHVPGMRAIATRAVRDDDRGDPARGEGPAPSRGRESPETT